MEAVKQTFEDYRQHIIKRITINNLIKYIIEGIAVAIAAYLIPQRKTKITEVLIIGTLAALTFMLLDLFAEDVGKASRYGSGFGIGYNMVQNPVTTFPSLATIF
jgi:hypothetical protein